MLEVGEEKLFSYLLPPVTEAVSYKVSSTYSVTVNGPLPPEDLAVYVLVTALVPIVPEQGLDDVHEFIV